MQAVLCEISTQGGGGSFHTFGGFLILADPVKLELLHGRPANIWIKKGERKESFIADQLNYVYIFHYSGPQTG